MVDAVSVPVTVKMRSGFEDTSLFEENLLAAQETGVAYLTLHPRTKVDGYGSACQMGTHCKSKRTARHPCSWQWRYRNCQ